MLLILIISQSLAWNYALHGSDWTGTCSNGKSQSPINIEKSSTQQLNDQFKMQVYYYGTTMSRTVVYTENSISMSGDFGYITIRDSASYDRKFMTDKIVFHAPSEHYVEGFPTHMEMQIFHHINPSDDDFKFPKFAVVSVMLRPGDQSFFFDSIGVSNLPEFGGQNILPNTSNINLISIVQSDDNYFFYNGSWTTPNSDYQCEENVLWYVFETQQWISFSQINSFMKKLIVPNSDKFYNIFGGSGNTRSVQPLNKRTVYYSFGRILAVLFMFLF